MNTAAIEWAITVEVVAPGVVAATEGVAVETVGVITVAEVEEARLGQPVAQDDDKVAASVEATGVVAAAPAKMVGRGMAREAVSTATDRRPPSARHFPREKTTTR